MKYILEQMMVQWLGRLFLFYFALAHLSGCAQHLCALHASPAMQLPVHAPKDVTTAQWMMLMMRGPGHTCTGQPIVPDAQVPSGLRPMNAIEHVIAFEGAGAKKHIVWLKTHEAGALQFGPVAVVTESGRGFAVEAMGTLQALAGETRLRMASKPAGQALWVISKQCAFHPVLLRHLCREQLQVLPRKEHTFVSTLEAPLIDLQRQQAQQLLGGWYRITEQEVQVDVEDMALILQETIAVKEVSAVAPKLTPRHRRTASNRRTVTYGDETGWTQSEPALWPRVARSSSK